MNIKHLAHIISPLILAVVSFAPITGYSTDKVFESGSLQKSRYNIGNKPNYTQWNSKETGNLVVVFTAQGSPRASQAVQGIYKYSMLLNKDKTNIAFKDFTEDDFSCFTLRPGEYTIKSILSVSSKSAKSTISYSRFVVKPGQTTAVWSCVNGEGKQPLLVKSMILDTEKAQYVYATATSGNPKLKLNPNTLFEHQIPQGIAANSDQLKVIKKLEVQKSKIKQDTAAIRTHSTSIEQDIETKTKTLEPLYKWKRLVLNKEERAAEDLALAKRDVERVLETVNDLKEKKRNIQQKMTHFSEWLSRGRAANVQDKLAVISSERELGEIDKKIANSDLTITNMSAVLKKKKKVVDGLFKKYEQLTAEQTVLVKICRDGTKAKEKANTGLALIDKEIGDLKNKIKKEEKSMETLMTSDNESDDKLGQINKTIKNIKAEIYRKQTKRQAALDHIDDCLLQLGKHKEKLNSVSGRGFELLKSIELAKKEVETAEHVLSKAKLSQKDILVDKKLLESRLKQAQAGIVGHTSRGKEYAAESEDLKKRMEQLRKEERDENQRVAGLRKVVRTAQEAYDTAKNNLNVIEKKIEATESSIDDLKKVLVSNKERERLLAVNVEEIESKIRIAQNNAKLETENVHYRSHKQALNKTIDELRNRESSLEEKIKFERQQVSMTKKQMGELENELKKLKGELAKTRNNSEAGVNKAKKIAADLKKSEVARKLLKSEVASITQKLDLQQKELEESKSHSSKLARECLSLKDKIEELSGKALAKDEVIVQNRNRLNEIKERDEEKERVIRELKKSVSEALANLEKERKASKLAQQERVGLLSKVQLAEDRAKSAMRSNEFAQDLTKELKDNQQSLKDRMAALEAELKVANQTVLKERLKAQVAQKELVSSKELSNKKIKEMQEAIGQLAKNKKDLQEEVAELEKMAKLKDVLVASYSKELREDRELSRLIGYRRVPTRDTSRD